MYNVFRILIVVEIFFFSTFVRSAKSIATPMDPNNLSIQVANSEMVLRAGLMQCKLQLMENGVRIASLKNEKTDIEFFANQSIPLFELELQDIKTQQKFGLTAEDGWKEISITPLKKESGIEIRWLKPLQKDLEQLSVQVKAISIATTNEIKWDISIDNSSKSLSLISVTFPHIRIAEFGKDMALFVPNRCGQVKKDAWEKAFHYWGCYPSALATLGYIAAYDDDTRTGMYFGVHDPLGSIKDINIDSVPENHVVDIKVVVPAANSGFAGNDFKLNGQVVWRLFDGDWYDASQFYRQWVIKDAAWYPRLGHMGREDTPLWFRELCFWTVVTHDVNTPIDTHVPQLQKMREFMGVPIGSHWYGWNRSGQDNDMPNFAPPKNNFENVVKKLASQDIYVMPYLNGRMWDRRDKGLEDFTFTTQALPWTLKDSNGCPYLELYGNLEKDNSPIQLAPMCPYTKFWQDKVRNIVLENNYGTQGAYLDQIASAGPRLCYDASHGHTLGGGTWWTSGYRTMLNKLRKADPSNRIIISEDNSEVYMDGLDGYLTWSCNYGDQVPAFSSVYGGAVQMLGRAYRLNDSECSFRLRAAQQLMYGEQIGWILPSFIDQTSKMEFMRRIVQLRKNLCKYFYAGRMMRAPRIQGKLPKVSVNLDWLDEPEFSVQPVLTGAWSLPQDKKIILMFVNITDSPISFEFDYQENEYNIKGRPIRVLNVGANGEVSAAVGESTKKMQLQPYAIVAWEFNQK